MINVHGGIAGYHPGQTMQAPACICADEGISESKHKAFNTNKKKEFIERMNNEVGGEYLAYLCIMQANNNKFGNLNKSFVNDGLKGDSSNLKTPMKANLLLKGYQAIGGEKTVM